jgi:hypothetical protein
MTSATSLLINQVAKGAGLAALAVSGIVLVPLQWLPKCPIHAVTGLLCPGCGIQRAIIALSRGDFQAAIHLNALLLVAPIFVITGWIAQAKNLAWLKWLTVGAAAVATVVFTIYRNLN